MEGASGILWEGNFNARQTVVGDNPLMELFMCETRGRKTSNGSCWYNKPEEDLTAETAPVCVGSWERRPHRLPS